MQDYLDENPEAELQIYAVWLPALSGDARDRWNAQHLDDPRVLHYWDQNQLLGRWYKTHEDFQGVFGSYLWDAWVLYGEDSSWETQPVEPSERIGWGRTIILTATELGEALDGLGSLPAPTPSETATEAPPPTVEPSSTSTATAEPSEAPTQTQTPTPAQTQTDVPTSMPTSVPTASPTSEPSSTPAPTLEPTAIPSQTSRPTETRPPNTPEIQLRPVWLPLLVTRS